MTGHAAMDSRLPAGPAGSPGRPAITASWANREGARNRTAQPAAARVVVVKGVISSPGLR